MLKLSPHAPPKISAFAVNDHDLLRAGVAGMAVKRAVITQ